MWTVYYAISYFCWSWPIWFYLYPVSILYKSIVGRYRPVRVGDGPVMARYRFIKNASWVHCVIPEAYSYVYLVYTFEVSNERAGKKELYIKSKYSKPRWECASTELNKDLRRSLCGFENSQILRMQMPRLLSDTAHDKSAHFAYTLCYIFACTSIYQ